MCGRTTRARTYAARATYSVSNRAKAQRERENMKLLTAQDLRDTADRIDAAGTPAACTHLYRYLAQQLRPAADEYQGWPNHATWAVALHLGNDEGLYLTCQDLTQSARESAKEGHDTWTPELHARFTLADALKDFVEELLDEARPRVASAGSLLAQDLCSVGPVDWNRLAAAYLEE